MDYRSPRYSSLFDETFNNLVICVGREHKNSGDAALSLKHMEERSFPKPSELAADENQEDKDTHKEEIKITLWKKGINKRCKNDILFLNGANE